MKVIIWTPEIDNLYLKKGLIGGLPIQMRYWAETFVRKGWEVYAPTYNESRTYNGIMFFKYHNIPKVGFVTEYLFAMYHLLRIKPDLIVLRGARRQLGSVATFAKLLNIKIVFQGASDADFKPEQELINDWKSRVIYRIGVRKTNYFVLQNKNQEVCLNRNYGKKKSIIIPNIWPTNGKKNTGIVQDIDFLWVGNFRELKRPQWFIQLAEDNPQYKFAMVGGDVNKEVYRKNKEKAERYDNLDFLGKMDFDDVNKLFERAKIYVCTSEIEGFPNTLLQAWDNNIPLITTIDPSDTVKKNGLGLSVNSYEELKENAARLITDSALQQSIKSNIAKYFKTSHNTDIMYKRLIAMLKE